MKRIFCIIAAGLLAFCLPATPPARAETAEYTVKVGLVYGSNALPGANLQNAVGAGYAFGYYDAARVFVPLAETALTKISVVKNRNVKYDGANYIDGTTGAVVGCFHVDTGESYNAYADAKTAADALTAQGYDAFVHYTSGKFGVRVGNWISNAAASERAAAYGFGKAVTGSTYCVSVVETGGTKIIFQFDTNSTSTAFGVSPKSASAAAQTWSKGYKYYGGFEYSRRDQNNLAVINVVGIDAYTKGVIPYEMSPSWHIEALKAQALCARTFAYYQRNKHGFFDVCTGTDCQVYHGVSGSNANSDKAVDQTAGMFLLSGGKLINAVYHSSNGGSTENSENVWSATVPYLRATADPYEDLSKAQNGRWEKPITNAQISAILAAKGYPNSGITSVSQEFTAADNILRLKFTDAEGKAFTFSKESARSILNSSAYGTYTNSQRFKLLSGAYVYAVTPSGVTPAGTYILDKDGKTATLTKDTLVLGANGVLSQATAIADGNYLVAGSGWGHNVGLSQYGAKGMAEKGFTYDKIVKFYYSGVTIGKYS